MPGTVDQKDFVVPGPFRDNLGKDAGSAGYVGPGRLVVPLKRLRDHPDIEGDHPLSPI